MKTTDVRPGPRASESIEREVSRRLERIISTRTAQAAAHGPEFTALWQEATHCVPGGKLLRPKLLIGAFDTLTPTGPAPASPDTALDLAAALELLHFAFLLHDDLIDDDLRRRGEPNLMGRLLSSSTDGHEATDPTAHEPARLHWARSSGLLIGDLMLTIAHQAFARASLPELQRLRVLDLLDAAVTETVAGEYLDVALSDDITPPDLGLVLNMTRMKTAGYTFELPLRMAAVISGADRDIEQQLGSVGRHLGLAFQLQDDLLSAFGASETHGKDQFSDFREGKQTALIGYARLTDAWPSIAPLLGSENFTDASGATIQRLLTECGARELIESMVQDQVRAALNLLSLPGSELPPETTRFILGLVDSLDRRSA